MQIRDLFADTPIHQDTLASLELQRLMREPIDVTHDWQRAERLLQIVIEQLPHRLETQVALFKMYAYDGQHDKAEALICKVLAQAAERVGIDRDWRQLTATSASWKGATGDVRCYLYSMKALGFVSLRQGNIARAEAVLNKLQELDTDDEIGSSVVYQLALALSEETDDEELYPDAERINQ
ncbi:MAG: hypothetical protein CMI09_14340 [Oceanospirillaceae bacterium]|nr:hypothetical protein [Oceanospirillaceae bacterium]